MDSADMDILRVARNMHLALFARFPSYPRTFGPTPGHLADINGLTASANGKRAMTLVRSGYLKDFISVAVADDYSSWAPVGSSKQYAITDKAIDFLKTSKGEPDPLTPPEAFWPQVLTIPGIAPTSFISALSSTGASASWLSPSMTMAEYAAVAEAMAQAHGAIYAMGDLFIPGLWEDTLIGKRGTCPDPGVMLPSSFVDACDLYERAIPLVLSKKAELQAQCAIEFAVWDKLQDAYDQFTSSPSTLTVNQLQALCNSELTLANIRAQARELAVSMPMMSALCSGLSAFSGGSSLRAWAKKCLRANFISVIIMIISL